MKDVGSIAATAAFIVQCANQSTVKESLITHLISQSVSLSLSLSLSLSVSLSLSLSLSVSLSLSLSLKVQQQKRASPQVGSCWGPQLRNGQVGG